MLKDSFLTVMVLMAALMVFFQGRCAYLIPSNRCMLIYLFIYFFVIDHKSHLRSEQHWRSAGLDLHLQQETEPEMVWGQPVVPEAVDTHGGFPEPGGDWFPQQSAAVQPQILLDRHCEKGWSVDLGWNWQQGARTSSELVTNGAR